LNIPVLEKVMENLPSTKCYAGACSMPIQPKDFISGTCMVFSKDVAELLTKSVTCQHEHRHVEDDLIIFEYMKQYGIPLTNIPMYYYDKNIIPSYDEISKILEQYPLIRVKNMADRMKIDTAIWTLIKEII
jgi:hypothetical protein